MKRPNFKVGDKVFAKVKGYPPWPAHIVAENGKKFNVEFYGTGETGSIKSEDLFYYLKNKEKFQKPLKRKDYIDAFEQIEEAVKEDGGDGDESPNSNDSISNESLNSSSANNSIAEKTEKKTGIKRKRSLPQEPPAETSTPKKKSARLSKVSEDVQKSEISETTDEPEKVHKSVSPKKSPKITKSPKVDIEKEKVAEVKEETKPEENDENKPKDDKIAEKESVKDETTEIEVTSEVMEKEEVEETPVEKQYKIDLVTEKSLKNNIIYAEHVKKSEKLFKDRKPDPREDDANQVLPVKLSSGKMGGIKLHLTWPLKFDNEYDRAIYDETVSKRVLDAKQKIEEGTVSLEDMENIIPDIELSAEGVDQMVALKQLEDKKVRVARLKLEAELLRLDVKIKNCLGLDKADPKEALGYLEEMCNLEFDDVVLKKHLHIVEMVRRLRKYVGNTREWKMNDESLNEFTKQAEKVREMAEKVYGKFKQAVKLPENCSSFFEGFTDLVNQFRADCKELELTESDIFVLSSEPRSRQAFLNRLDEKETEKNTNDATNPVQEKLIVNGTAEVSEEAS